MPHPPTIAATILRLLDERGPEKTICPSEVARALYSETAWRQHMDAVRAAAQRLIDDGSIIATQKGRRVDLAKAKGPVRLKRS